MTSLDSPQQGAEQPGEQPVQAPVPPGTNPAMTNVPGLPPTALSMQMQSANEQIEQQRMFASTQDTGPVGAPGAGGTPGAPQTTQPPIPGQPQPGNFGQSSLRDLAEQLATGYGLNFSRGSLVDAQGNFTMTPDQLMAQQGAGGDLSDTAAQMNYIAQAINDQRVQMQQDKATASLQAGAGLLQKRGRGSLAALQSNFYQAMAANYTNPNLLPEQQDFSYWIQKDQMEEAEADRELERRSAGGGDGDGGGGGNLVTQNDIYNSGRGTTTGPQGRGDLVTTGPNAGRTPVYTYDPISQTTTMSWE